MAPGVGELVAPGAEGGEVGGEEERAGPVETARRWIPGFFEDAERFESALSPRGDRPRQVGRGTPGRRGQRGVQRASGGGEAGTRSGGGQAHRVLPERQLGDRIAAGGEQRMRAGSRVRGQLVQRERVRAARRARVGRRLLGMRGRWQRRRERWQRPPGDGITGPNAGEGRRFLLLGGAGRAGGVAAGQRVQQLAFPAAAQQEQHEGVFVQQTCHLVAEGCRVLAGVAEVGAAAVRFELARAGEQRDPALRERLGHLLVEQRGDVPRPLGGRFQETVPVAVGQRPHADLHAIRPRPAPVHIREHQPRGDRDGVDVPVPGVRPPARQPRRVQRPLLQGRHPRVPPPRLREGVGVRHPRGERGERTAQLPVAAGGCHGPREAARWGRGPGR